MNIWNSIAGQVVLQLVSADIPGVLLAVSIAGIRILHSEPEDDMTIRLTIDRRDLPAVIRLTQKRGEQLSVLSRRGIYWTVRQGIRRPVLLVAVLVLLFLTLFLPTRILFVRVEGNETIPGRQILAAAEECGIRFGAAGREVRSEKVKNRLLERIAGLQWAGVNIKGCVVTISVRERRMEPTLNSAKDVSSLVAARAGLILSCTVTAGTGQCAPGQAVQQGQVLISGYTDCGLVLQATRAEGEVYAQTYRPVTAVAMSRGYRPVETGQTSRSYSLILGKKRINFANSSRICDATCGRMYKEYYITLPGGFVLPIALAVQTHICREAVPFDKDPRRLQEKLSVFAREYVSTQMISGQIDHTDTMWESADGICILRADYLCREMICKRVQERKVSINGKSG